MGTSTQDISRSLQVMAAGFHDQGKQLNELYTASPAAFHQVILSLLLEAKDTARFRFLIAYLAARGLLPESLAALRSVDRNGAAVVTELAERMMPPGTQLTATPAKTAGVDLDFTLGLLEAVTLGLNLLFVAIDGAEQQDPKIRSRLAMILGKAARTYEAFSVLSLDEDARVRANAAEALWGSQGELANGIFRRAAEDPHHRVMANGLVGLYLQGDPMSVAGLARLARDPEELPLSAAVWAMGRTGDPRFLDLIESLRRVPGQSPNVTKNCLAAAKRIRHCSGSQQRQALKMRILQARRGEAGEVELVASLRPDKPAELPKYAGTNFALQVGGRTVWEYTVKEEVAGPKAAVAVLLPVGTEGLRSKARSYRELLAALHAALRPGDRLSVNFYAEQPVGRQTADYGVNELTKEHARLQQLLEELPGLGYLLGGPLAPLKGIVEQMAAFEGEKHVLCLVDTLAAGLEKGSAEPLKQAGIQLHFVLSEVTGADQGGLLRQEAERTGGLAVKAETGLELMEAAADLYSGLFRRFHVRGYQVGAGEELALELHADLHHAKARMKLK